MFGPACPSTRAAALLLLWIALPITCLPAHDAVRINGAIVSSDRLQSTPQALSYPPSLQRPLNYIGLGSQNDRHLASSFVSTDSTTMTPFKSVERPSCRVTGYIQWSSEHGYMDNGTGPDSDDPGRKDPDTVRLITSTRDPSKIGLFSFDSCSTGPVCMRCLNCPQADRLPCLGLQQNLQSCKAGNSDSPSCMSIITLTRQLPSSSRSQRGMTLWKHDWPFESDVWLYNNATGELRLQWTNSDGTSIPLIGRYDYASNKYAIPFAAPSLSALPSGYIPTSGVLFTLVPIHDLGPAKLIIQS